jgi:hypothetical protein
MITITAYQVAKRINEVLEAAEVDKVIPPQMMYTYAKKGYINGVKGAKGFTEDEVEAYVAKYVSKYVAVEVVETVEA